MCVFACLLEFLIELLFMLLKKQNNRISVSGPVGCVRRVAESSRGRRLAPGSCPRLLEPQGPGLKAAFRRSWLGRPSCQRRPRPRHVGSAPAAQDPGRTRVPERSRPRARLGRAGAAEGGAAGAWGLGKSRHGGPRAQLLRRPGSAPGTSRALGASESGSEGHLRAARAHRVPARSPSRTPAGVAGPAGAAGGRAGVRRAGPR
ncbi:PREDICTED: uncharacterized protein LOC106148151, partial [Chinchilla lanigera]|uniref:uncharacterized protein LOC106148151 n=1 Tax=Chinchilla lanigera TaxID=34839 RepID=UPI0006961DE7